MEILKNISKRPLLKNTLELSGYFVIGAMATLLTEATINQIKSDTPLNDEAKSSQPIKSDTRDVNLLSTENFPEKLNEFKSKNKSVVAHTKINDKESLVFTKDNQNKK